MPFERRDRHVTDPQGSADRPGTSGEAAGGTATVTLSAEQLLTATEWVESGHVRFRRRIVTETRTVDVEVRREELIIEVRGAVPGPVGESYLGTVLDGPAVAAPVRSDERVVVLLREEVPVVTMQPRVYERITTEIVRSTGVAVLHDNVRHEEVRTEEVRTETTATP